MTSEARPVPRYTADMATNATSRIPSRRYGRATYGASATSSAVAVATLAVRNTGPSPVRTSSELTDRVSANTLMPIASNHAPPPAIAASRAAGNQRMTSSSTTTIATNQMEPRKVNAFARPSSPLPSPLIALQRFSSTSAFAPDQSAHRTTPIDATASQAMSAWSPLGSGYLLDGRVERDRQAVVADEPVTECLVTTAGLACCSRRSLLAR